MAKRIIRIFLRRTSATPDDADAIVGRGPDMFDEADEVHISVVFTWDIPLAEKLAKEWKYVAPVSVGGPAYGDAGGEFTPGMYLKKGYLITSRGCPNSCWFCRAWRNEGRTIRELKIHDGWNILDNNLLACSIEHQRSVFEMLSRQPQKARFTGGLEAARMTAWHAEWLAKLKPQSFYFAYDTPDDYEPLVAASNLLKDTGLLHNNHAAGCYVLIGYKGDTIEKAEKRLIDVVKLGFMPQAMLYDRGVHFNEADRLIWRRYQREWANKVIVGYKVSHLRL